jgi:hypothetical protein
MSDSTSRIHFLWMRRIAFWSGSGIYACCIFIGCGGGGGNSGGGTQQPTITSVTVTCTPTSVQTGQTSQCSATVSGTGSYTSAVNWSATGGAVTTAGVFTPSTSGTATITATSAQDATKSGSASVTVVVPATITSVSVACSPTSILTTQTSACTSTLTGTGSFSTSVSWSVSPSGIGAISSAGVFTPVGAGMATITATSTQDSTKSGSFVVTVNVPPSITSVTLSCNPTSIQATETSQCAATVTGIGNFSPAVTWSADSGSITTSGLFTASSVIPASGIATVKATATQDSTKSGIAPVSIFPYNSSVTIVATPASGGPGNGPWTLSIAAKDDIGNPSIGVTMALTASEGTLSQSTGTTDANGWLTATISPPSMYDGEAVAVSATANGQTAAVDIVFAPYSYSAMAAGSVTLPIVYPEASSASSAFLTTPFLFGTSSATGTNTPWLTPNACFSNVSLNSTIPENCQTILYGDGLSQLIPKAANTVCKTADTLTNVAGAASCVGIAATIVSCALSPTGLGAVICAGGLTYSATLSSLCVGYIADEMAQFISKSQADQRAMNLIAAGVEPGPPSIGDAVEYLCEQVEDAAIGQGTGTLGATVTIAPLRQAAVLGNSVQFTAQTSDKSSVTWAVNGVIGASGPFGAISSNGLYTAPLSLPFQNYVSVTATSVSDPTATAPAVIQLLAAPPGTITTVVGNGTPGYTGDNGAAISAELYGPSGVDFDSAGNMFIGDTSNNVVRKVDASTQIITTIAGTGVPGFSGDGGLGASAELNHPGRATFDRDLNIYITDENNERVRRVNSVTHVIQTVAGNGTPGFSGDGGPATDAELNFPNGEATDSNGDLYIADSQNNRLRKLTVSTGIITTVAGNGLAGYSGDGVPATDAALNFPSRPYIDPNGNIYIADYGNDRVRKVDGKTGIITTVAGNGIAGYSGDGGAATSAELNGPLSVVLDSSGILYIADINNSRIRAVNTSANSITVMGITIQPGQIMTVVGTGVAGYSGDSGPGIAARVNLPTGLSVDSQDNLFFADSNNNVVRKVIAQH